MEEADEEVAVSQEVLAEEEDGGEAEEEAAEQADVIADPQQPPADDIPAEVILERPGGAASVTAQTDALGTALLQISEVCNLRWDLFNSSEVCF